MAISDTRVARGRITSRSAGALRLALVAALSVGLVLGARAAAAERPTPEVAERFIADLADRAASKLTEGTGTLDERESALRELLREGFAMDLIARVALGKYWRKTPDADRSAYVELFGEFLLRTYASKLAAFDRKTFEVVETSPRGKRDVIVETRISPSGGAPIRAGWRVRLFDGKPRIIDILVEGVSMALNQRQEFNSVLSKSGFSGLMEMLRARTQRLPAEGPKAG